MVFQKMLSVALAKFVRTSISKPRCGSTVVDHSRLRASADNSCSWCRLFVATIHKVTTLAVITRAMVGRFFHPVRPGPVSRRSCFCFNGGNDATFFLVVFMRNQA